MVNTGKLAVITVLAVLGVGALGGGFFAGDFIATQLEEGIEDSLVVSPNFATEDPKDYADWLTNEDADDPPKFKKYYFWNLTNPNEYLAGITPAYVEIGPYSYRQFDRKLNVVITDTTVSYDTYTYYEFDATSSFAGASVDDKIVNVNPAYLGVISGAGSEAALVTGFVGPTVASIMDGLTTDFTNQVSVKGTAGGVEQIMDGLLTSFPDKVLVGAIPTVLQQVQEGVIEGFHKVVNATTAAAIIANNWGVAQSLNGSDQANADFFNSTQFFANYSAAVALSALPAPIQGLGDVTGTNLGYSNATATKLLFTGPGVGSITGWTGDLVQGTGILGYLALYNNATKGLGGMDNGTLQGLYGATQVQLDAAAQYLAIYLIDDNAVVEATYVAGAGEPTLTTATSMFYAQWANATFQPGGADIDANGIVPDGFEVGLPIASDIDAATAVALFDPTNGLSFANDTGIQAWFGAILGDTGLQVTLAAAFTGLNATQFGLLYNWLGLTFKDGIATAGLLQQLALAGVVTMEDVGYLHWGSPAVTSGLSANDIDPTTGGWIEIWAYADRILGATFNFGINTSKALMSGTYNLTDPESAGTFMFLGSQAITGNATALGTLNFLFETSLDTSQVVMVLQYLDYVLETLVVPTFGGDSAADFGYLHWGSPHVTDGKSVHLDLDPESTLPGVPEFWAWAANVSGTPYTFNLTNSRALTTSSVTAGTGDLTNSTLVGLVLLSAPVVLGSDATAAAIALGTINAVFGSKLNSTDVQMLAGYLQYLMQVYVAGFTLAPIFAAGGGLITERTVDEWLWDYEDPLLQFLVANGLTDDASNNFFDDHDSPTDPRITETPPNVFKTGGDNIDNVGQYVEYQGLTAIPDRDVDPENGVWGHEEAVIGTDATQFSPGVVKDDVLDAWVSELVRSVIFVYQEDVVVEGIDLLRFVLDDSVLDVDPAFDQSVKGVANMTYGIGAPLFISKPHFLDAAPGASSVGGLSPSSVDHDTFIDVEPTTGATLQAAKRLQISFQVGPGNFFTPGIGSTDLLPIVWVEEGGAITADLANDFKDAVYGAQQLEDLAPIGGTAIGVVLLLTAAFIGVRARKP